MLLLFARPERASGLFPPPLQPGGQAEPSHPMGGKGGKKNHNSATERCTERNFVRLKQVCEANELSEYLSDYFPGLRVVER